MKKYFILCLMVSLLAFAGVAAAAKVELGGTADVEAFLIGTESFRLSSNVQLNVNASASEYAAVAGHLQGDKQYGTTSAENTIVDADKTKGAFTDLVAPSGTDELGGVFDSATTP